MVHDIQTFQLELVVRERVSSRLKGMIASSVLERVFCYAGSAGCGEGAPVV
jgi:hypothetical protein